MVRVYAPALSIDASGTLADSMVFSKWKGRNYVRSHVSPAQPRSGSQVGVRAMFKFLAQIWQSLTTEEAETWADLAKSLSVSKFNAFMKYNQSRWRNFLTPSKETPAAETATAPAAPTVVGTAGIRQATLAITKGAQAPDFGYLIHRSTETSFTPAFSNCIAVVPIDESNNGSYVDTPLPPGTYYYKATGFMDDGKKGTASAEEDVTIE
jgi:hypothetical protein